MISEEDQIVAEKIRRQHLVDINSDPGDREVLEAKHGKVYNSDELQQEFVVEGFFAPYIVCTRKSDNVQGSMQFQGEPRFYFNFEPDSE